MILKMKLKILIAIILKRNPLLKNQMNSLLLYNSFSSNKLSNPRNERSKYYSDIDIFYLAASSEHIIIFSISCLLGRISVKSNF